MISQQPSHTHHTVDRKAFPETFASSTFTAAAHSDEELCHTPLDPSPNERVSLLPSLSYSTPSPRVKRERGDRAVRHDPEPSRPHTVRGPLRSSTIQPLPKSDYACHPLSRHSSVVASSGNVMPSCITAGGFDKMDPVAAAKVSPQMSDMGTKHQLTSPLNAFAMDSLVRRYRAEEELLHRWRQSGERVPTSTALEGGGMQPSCGVEGAQDEWGGPTHKENFDDAHDAADEHQYRGGGGFLPKRLLGSVQDAPILRGVRAWWQSRKELQRMTGKVDKRLYASTLYVSSATVAGAGMQRHSRRTALPTLSNPVASSGISSASSLSWMSRAGRTVLARLSHSLPRTSGRGASICLDLIGPAATAQGYDVHGHDDSNTVHGNSAEAASPLLTVPHARDEASVVLRRAKLFHAAPFEGLGRTPFWPKAGGEGQTNAEGDLSTPTVSRAVMHGAKVTNMLNRELRLERAGENRDCRGLPLSGIGGPLSHQSYGGATAVSVDGTVDSHGSVARSPLRSRAHYIRWLRLQMRLKSARSSLRGMCTWSRPAAVVDEECLKAVPCAEDATAASVPLPATSQLHRCAAQAELSPWELALPQMGAGERESSQTLGERAGPHDPTSSSQISTRAQILEQLKVAVASGTAVSLALERGLVKPEAVSEVQASPKKAPVLSRDAQRTREHAEDLARLTESLTMLTHAAGEASASTITDAHVGGINSREHASPVPAAGIEQEPNTAAVPLFPAGGEEGGLLSAQSSLYGHTSSIVSAGKYSPLLHRRAADSPNTVLRTRSGENCLQTRGDNASGAAFRSLLTDTTHTPHDVQVRAVYETIIRDVCTPLVRREVEGAISLSYSATDHALTQWVGRQLVSELTQLRGGSKKTRTGERDPSVPSASVLQPLLCTGVTQHILSGTPVSLTHLRLDDVDRQILESVEARGASDATAIKFDSDGYTITYRQLASLRSRSWLNDQVINNYLQLLCVESEASANASLPTERRRHRIASLGTHFYTKVESEYRNSRSDSHTSQRSLPQLSSGSAILRWLRHRKHLLQPYVPSDPRSVRIVLVPVNIEAQHWALAVFYCAENRWVMYDSMSRSDVARQRGARILTQLSHAWRECQRHFGLVSTENTSVAQTAITDQHVQTTAAPRSSLWVETEVVAAPYVPLADTVRGEGHAVPLPLDSMHPYDSLDGLHRAAKRLRHQEELFVEQAVQKTSQVVGGARWDAGKVGATCTATTSSVTPMLTRATKLPAAQLSDTEVEWFTGGFDHVPQQANGNDCGVFVCQVAWCISQGVAVNFTQSDVTRLRTVILLELFNKKLLRRYPTANTSSSAGV